jgi:hypothetical protein
MAPKGGRDLHLALSVRLYGSTPKSNTKYHYSWQPHQCIVIPVRSSEMLQHPAPRINSEHLIKGGKAASEYPPLPYQRSPEYRDRGEGNGGACRQTQPVKRGLYGVHGMVDGDVQWVAGMKKAIDNRR